MKRHSLWLVCLLLAWFVSSVHAQEPTHAVTDDEVNRVARELYCPICENTPLDVCETQACEDWRQLIRQKLAAGETPEQIVEYFAARYGERARALPTTRGFSKWVWVAPVVLGIGGLLYMVYLLRRWLARGAVAAPEVPTVPPPLPDDVEVDEYVQRLEQQVRDS